MNGAEIIYKPSFLQPYVAGDLWQAINRIRALGNSCYFISPKVDADNLHSEVNRLMGGIWWIKQSRLVHWYMLPSAAGL